LCSIVFVEEIRGARWEGIGEGEASHEKERTRGEEYLGKGSRKGERIVITTKVGGVFNWDESGWEVGGCMEGIGIPTCKSFASYPSYHLFQPPSATSSHRRHSVLKLESPALSVRITYTPDYYVNSIVKAMLMVRLHFQSEQNSKHTI
jgi:hypothetical protein